MRCFKMRGKKGDEHFDPDDPPRRRANKRRGRGTYANDRPPILGTVGRETGQVRLRVVDDTKGVTLREHVHRFTDKASILNTDEYQSYNGVERIRETVCHGAKEYARDDDGDGFHGLCSALGSDVLLGCDRYHRPVWCDPFRWRRAANLPFGWTSG